MAIKAVNVNQVKVQPEANINQTISASKSVAASLAKETAIANQVTGLTVNSLNKSLTAAGQEQALLDAAKDSKAQDDYITAKDKYDTLQTEKARLDKDGIKYDEKLGQKTVSDYNNAKLAIEENKLKMDDTTFTNYGKSYQKKAQAIGLNKMVINLDKESAALAIEYKEDPAGYAQAMTQYRIQSKEYLPKELHAAYDEKSLISQNSYAKKINANVKKIQDEDLAATTIEKMDLTRTNLLNAAVSDDKAGYVSANKSYKQQLQSMVDSRIMSQAKADEIFRGVSQEATQQLIMSDFTKILKTDPAGATAYAEYFANKTSGQMFGLSKRELENTKKIPKGNTANPLDIEYDTVERDKMATLMLSTMTKYNKELAAKNKQTKTDNNKFLGGAIDVYKQGKNFSDSNSRIATMSPGSYGQYEMDEYNFYKDNWTKIALFNDLTVVNQQAQISLLESKDKRSDNENKLLIALKEANEAKIKGLNTDSGKVAQDGLPNDSKPQFNSAAPSEFLNSMLPTVIQQNLENNSSKNLLSNEQAEQTKAHFDSLGFKDQLAYVNSIGSGEVADMFFEQMGESGSSMENIYNIVKGKSYNSVVTAETILRGHERIKAKMYKPAKEVDLKNYYYSNLNGRGIDQDMPSQEALYNNVLAYAIENNPENVIEEKDIKDAIDVVFGKTADLGGINMRGTGFFSPDTLNQDMVVYERNADQVQGFLDNVTENQIIEGIPEGTRFYTGNSKTGLKPEDLKRDIQLGYVKFIGTGVSGEYILQRGGSNNYISTGIQTETKNDKGDKVWNHFEVYKFKLWKNGAK